MAFLDGVDSVPTCSEVTRVEITRRLRSAERAAADRLFAELRWCPVDEEVARLVGELGRTHPRSHRHANTLDLIVAATAERLALPLATSNVKHFPMFPRLKPPTELDPTRRGRPEPPPSVEPSAVLTRRPAAGSC